MTDCKDIFLKPDEDDFGFLLWSIMRLWQRERQKYLDKFNTTVSQMELLGGVYYLNRVQGEITQIVLSQQTGIDPMTTSTILRNLEKKGLVIRKPSKTDTRARIVESTEKGDTLLFSIVEDMRKAQDKVLKNINQEIVKDELKKLLSELKKENI